MKPRVLVLAGFYLPGYLAGGPVRSIANLVERLAPDFDWLILTSDRDLGAGAPYEGVRVDAWNAVGGAQVFYAGPAARSPARLLNLIRDTPHDLLYLNSFFDFRFGILPVLAQRLRRLPRKPLLVAPRGEFSGGAYRLKAWKKRPYAAFARLAGLYRDAGWQASTEWEARDIQRVMKVPAAGIHVARDLSSPVQAGEAAAAASGPPTALRVCFLSRIARMKNLDYALRALARVREPVEFDIYGPQEDPAYWKECEQLLAGLPSNIRAAYRGAVPADRVHAVLADHDLLFLPTRGENFGHILAEAWSSGVPVLTSDQTPWRGLEHEGVGWDLPLDDLPAFARALERVSGWSGEERAASRGRCLAFARRRVLNDEDVETNRRMFLSVLSR